jgi:hypothetical protein
VLSVTLLASCELGGSMAVRRTAENAVKTPPTYKEALKSKKVRKQNADCGHPPTIVGKYSWTCLFMPAIGEQSWRDCFLLPAAVAVGSEEARLRAGLRPPLNAGFLHAAFAKTQRRRDNREGIKVEQPVQALAQRRLDAAAFVQALW